MLCEFTALRLPVMERVGMPRTCPCVRAACVLVLLTRLRKFWAPGGAPPAADSCSDSHEPPTLATKYRASESRAGATMNETA